MQQPPPSSSSSSSAASFLRRLGEEFRTFDGSEVPPTHARRSRRRLLLPNSLAKLTRYSPSHAGGPGWTPASSGVHARRQACEWHRPERRTVSDRSGVARKFFVSWKGILSQN